MSTLSNIYLVVGLAVGTWGGIKIAENFYVPSSAPVFIYNNKNVSVNSLPDTVKFQVSKTVLTNGKEYFSAKQNDGSYSPMKFRKNNM